MVSEVVECKGCGFFFPFSGMFKINGKERCYPCSVEAGATPHYLDQITRKRQQRPVPSEPIFTDKQIADNRFELAEMVQEKKYLDGKLDTILQNWHVLQPQNRLKQRFEIEDNYFWQRISARCRDMSIESELMQELFESPLGEAASHSYYEGGSFIRANAHNEKRINKIGRFLEHQQKLSKYYTEKLEQEAKHALVWGADQFLIERSRQRASKFCDTWGKVLQKLGTREIQAVFAACLASDLAAPLSQRQTAEGYKSLYPHMNRSTVVTWNDRVQSLERRGRNWRRSRMPEFIHDSKTDELDQIGENKG